MITKGRKILLFLDAIINFILGVLLLAYSEELARLFGVPIVESAFYPNILGAVFIGIGIALSIEYYTKNSKYTSGLGLLGAISINFCGGIVLFLWLILGNLNLPLNGAIFLWGLDIVLLVISSAEFVYYLNPRQ